MLTKLTLLHWLHANFALVTKCDNGKKIALLLTVGLKNRGRALFCGGLNGNRKLGHFGQVAGRKRGL